MKKGILTPQKHWGPPLAPKGCVFRFFKDFLNFFLEFSETFEMSSKQSGEMVEGNSADRCTGKFPLMSMGG